ncbi:hypothetical protein ACR77J_07875 [Tissierella praeacuta]
MNKILNCLLEELYLLSLQDNLTQLQEERYVKLYEVLTKNNVEIPFAIEI